jgi:hypothetical protein
VGYFGLRQRLLPTADGEVGSLSRGTEDTEFFIIFFPEKGKKTIQLRKSGIYAGFNKPSAEVTLASSGQGGEKQQCIFQSKSVFSEFPSQEF